MIQNKVEDKLKSLIGDLGFSLNKQKNEVQFKEKEVKIVTPADYGSP